MLASRDRENDQCVGGLRSPHRAVARIPGWGQVGARLQFVLSKLLLQHPDAEGIVGLLGAEDKVTDEKRLEALRQTLARRASVGSCSGTLKLLRSRENKPLGIVEPITPCGIFPLLTKEDRRHDAGLTLLGGRSRQHRKITPLKRRPSGRLVKSELNSSFTEMSRSKGVLQQKFRQLNYASSHWSCHQTET
jgi:hypothetical protein